MTFSYANLGNSPVSVSGFATTLYENSPFTGNLSAYNSQGQLLGSLSFSSVEDPLQQYLGYQSYSAVVGALDTNSLGPAANIASVVISTSDNDFALGTVAISDAPEPGTFCLVGISLLCVALSILKSAKGAVPRRHTAKELSAAVVRTRPVLRVFLRSRASETQNTRTYPREAIPPEFRLPQSGCFKLSIQTAQVVLGGHGDFSYRPRTKKFITYPSSARQLRGH
jgi:hypothetical protein